MRFLFQRIVHNSLNWEAASSGRLSSRQDGAYLANNGFAHEDWNFDKSLAKDGRVHGYTYFSPKGGAGIFSIAFATYDKGGVWTLAGFYRNARFRKKGPTYPASIIERRAKELFALKANNELGGDYKYDELDRIARRLGGEIRDHYHWEVDPDDVHAVALPVILPKRLAPKNASRYFTRPTNISQELFERLLLAALGTSDPETREDDDTEFPEGQQRKLMHIRRERSSALVSHVKSSFMKRHGRLFCQACGFDFGKKYGQIGADFIEAHHLIPVSKLDAGSTTKVSDMALVCSNCHRMLHRRRPWISKVEQLPLLLLD